MILTVLQNGCNRVSIPVNLQGNYVVSTTVNKYPSILSPWNVSIRYDDVFWASMNVNTESPPDVANYGEIPVRNVNEIVVYVCDGNAYYLTSDSLSVTVYIYDESGSLVSEYPIDLDVNVQPVYPYYIYVTAGTSETVTFYQEYYFAYAPTELDVIWYVPVLVPFTFTLYRDGVQYYEFTTDVDPCLLPRCEYLGSQIGFKCFCNPVCIPSSCTYTGSSCSDRQCTELVNYYSCNGYDLAVSPSSVVITYPTYTVTINIEGIQCSGDIVVRTRIPVSFSGSGIFQWVVNADRPVAPFDCMTLTSYLYVSGITL